MRTRNWLSIGAIAAACAAPQVVFAQASNSAPGVTSGAGNAAAFTDSGPTPKRTDVATRTLRPEYQQVRFDESWARTITGSTNWSDPLKHVSLSSDDASYFTVGGSYRWRTEFDRNYLFASAANDQGNFGLSRVLLSTDLRVGTASGPYVRAYGEFRDAEGFHKTVPGGLTAKDQDRNDAQDFFGEAGWGSVGVRYGRQDIVLGSERLVSVSDWTNARRAFQGLRARATFGNVSVDVLDAHVMALILDGPDRPDSTTRFRYASVGSAHDAAAAISPVPASWQAYVMQLDAVIGARNERSTYGTRETWLVPVAVAGGSQLSIEFEGAAQRGWSGNKVIEAWFFASEAQFKFRAIATAPKLIVGWDEGSGTKNTTNGVAGTFTTMYGSAHSFGGIADAFGRGNMNEFRAGAASDPASWLTLQAIVRSFTRIELADGVYNKSNSSFRAASGSHYRGVGTESDFTATAKVTRNAKLLAGIAQVDPGAFLKTTPGGAHSYRFSYVGSTLTF